MLIKRLANLMLRKWNIRSFLKIGLICRGKNKMEYLKRLKFRVCLGICKKRESIIKVIRKICRKIKDKLKDKKK